VPSIKSKMMGFQVVLAAVACVIHSCLAAQLHVHADAKISHEKEKQPEEPCERDDDDDEAVAQPPVRSNQPVMMTTSSTTLSHPSTTENLTVYVPRVFGGVPTTTAATPSGFGIDRGILHGNENDEDPAPTHTVGGRDIYYDCTLVPDRREIWSQSKLAYCCAKYGIDCPEAEEAAPCAQNTPLATPADVLGTIMNVINTSDPGIFPAPNQWVCGLLCQAHAKKGCCGWTTNRGPKSIQSNIHTGGYCEFKEGSVRLVANSGWQSATCSPGYGTAKCFNWMPGRCVADSTYGATSKSVSAAIPLPIWELVWEDQFDSDSCVLDQLSVWRPNPKFWTYEQGFKRGKEKQWYSPSMVSCRNGAMIIAAKKQVPLNRTNTCELKNFGAVTAAAMDPPLTNETCQRCGPPTFEYRAHCDIVQDDGSGAPACDCQDTADFLSGSVHTKDKKEFAEGGLFELKAKINVRSGAWPSWWAVGDFGAEWPKNGEIDILDAFQHIVKSSAHFADGTGNDVSREAARIINSDFENTWHTWQLEWLEKEIVVRIDSWEVFRMDLSVADTTGFVNPFTTKKPFFFILNLAVGGHLGGDLGQQPWPDTGVEFEIDHIRYMKKVGMTPR